MNLIERANQRRIKGIAKAVSRLVPNAVMNVLDVGCGDGSLARQIMDLLPGSQFEGVEVVLPSKQHVSMQRYNGISLPFEDNAFDAVLCADMLHHTDSPMAVLQEACRVAKSYVIVKDHICDSRLDRIILTVMDWLGNAGKGVPMPFRFLSSDEWDAIFDALPFEEVRRIDAIHYWSWPLRAVIDRRFHFVALLQAPNFSPR